MSDPIRPLDDDARRLARSLIAEARHAALATLDPDDGTPLASRIAVVGEGTTLLMLISDLSAHASALRVDPRCSAMLAATRAKGDPLTHPRMTLLGRAEPADKGAHRDLWLARHPKAALYLDFADFRMLRLIASRALLYAGFGQAYRLGPADLGERA